MRISARSTASEQLPRLAIVLAGLCLVGFSADSARAVSPDLWRHKDQPMTVLGAWTGPREMTSADAHRAYGEQDYGRARDLYARLYGESAEPELAYGLGSAALKLHEFDRANLAFSNALQASAPDLRYRAHRGLGTNLWDQGRGLLQGRPEATVKAWTDALRHYDSALKINPGDKESQANRDHIAKNLEKLKKQLDEQRQSEQQQQQQGDKSDKQDQKQDGKDKQKGQDGKGEKQEGEDGEPQDGEQGKDGKPQKGKDGKDPKDGKPGEQGEDGEDGDGGKPGEPKEQDKPGNGGNDDKKEDGEGEDKKDGESNEPSDEEKEKAEQMKKGNLQAQGDQGEQGDETKTEEDQEAEANATPDKETGYSPMDARNALKTYADEQRVRQQRRREVGVKKDW